MEKNQKLQCPLASKDKWYGCIEEKCAWYCVGDKACSVKVIAMELIKRNEK